MEGKVSTRPKVGASLICLKNTEEGNVVEMKSLRGQMGARESNRR